MLVGLTGIAIGVALIWIGWRHWRLRRLETVSLLEDAILRTTGEEPLPRTGLDKTLGGIQAVLGLVLGPFFIVAGVAALII